MTRQHFLGDLDRIYRECLDGVREAASHKPEESIGGWDVYGLTCAHEFATDLALAWSQTYPKEAAKVPRGHLDVYDLITATWPRKLKDDESGSASRLIAYGAATFSSLLVYIEAMRAERFDPTVPGGIRA